MTTTLHDERIEVVLDSLRDAEARSVLDLGCGTGDLLRRLLACPQFERIVGIDASMPALAQAERELPASDIQRGRLTLVHGSFIDPTPHLAGFDAVVMLETLEHVDPRRLSAVEHVVFTLHRPKIVIITTPNAEYNEFLGRDPATFRHEDHFFEWPRAKFERWARGVAQRGGYRVSFSAVGEEQPYFGAPTQMAAFNRASDLDLPDPSR